jgi:SHAQKYF class myb-like DNA-binding protein
MMDASPEPGLVSGGGKDDESADGIARRPGADKSEEGGCSGAHVHSAKEGRHGNDERESSATGSGGDDREESALLMHDEQRDGQASQDIGGEGKGPLGHGDTSRSDKGDKFERAEKFERADKNGERVDKSAECRQPRFWTAEEHKKFLEAVRLYGYGNARQIAAYVQTRNITQVSSLSLSLSLSRSLARARVLSIVHVVCLCVLCACSVCVCCLRRMHVQVCVCACVGVCVVHVEVRM